MSRRIIESVPEPLSDPEISVFLNRHIQYRLKLLQLARCVSPASGLVDSAMVEAGLIACRQMMQFLGLGITFQGGLKLEPDNKYYTFKKDGAVFTDEVKVFDVGGQYVKIADILLNDQIVLVSVFNAASKATAHMTDGSELTVNPQFFDRACLLIQELTVASIPAYQQA